VAKKRDLLDADYNPVAEQIRRYKQSVAALEPASQPPAAASIRDTPSARPQDPAKPLEALREDMDGAAVLPAPRPPAKSRPQAIVPQVTAAAEEAGQEDDARSALPAPGTGSDALSTSMRTRVTREEHQHWTDVCLRITGKQNQFSALVRALLIILENAQDQLEKKLPEIHRMRVPPRTDRLANSLYEYRLAEILYNAIEAAGRPKPQLARKDRTPEPLREGRAGHPR
jgi:hypothetical protein